MSPLGVGSGGVLVSYPNLLGGGMVTCLLSSFLLLRTR